jgi:hypothetical protein
VKAHKKYTYADPISWIATGQAQTFRMRLQRSRKPKAWWMRLFPVLKLYWCEKCGNRVLRKREAPKRAYTWHVPRRYR